MSRIVVGVDGSAAADRALRWAVREAELRSAVIELVYGYALHPHAAMFGRSDRDLANDTMDTIVERNRGLLDRVKWTTTLVALIAGPTGALLDVGEDADLIVVGSRGLGGFGELFVGGTSYRTAAHASAPVAVVREGGEPDDGARAPVVGVDGSRASRRALRWALGEAAVRGVGVTVVHAYYEPSDLALGTLASDQALEEYRQRAHADAVDLVDRALDEVAVPAAVDVERVALPGSPAGVLLKAAAPDRLLVVGTRGRGALGRTLFGSVSHQCLHHARGPMVVVP